MAQNPQKQPEEYTDGRTKQAFQEETDINRILQRAQVTGTISHLAAKGAFYADFADFDIESHQAKLDQAYSLFASVPSEIRREFNNSAAQFFEYVNDPANKGQLEKLLPQLAEPGRQRIDVSGKTPPGVGSEPQANVTNTPQGGSTSTPQAAGGGQNGA